MFQTPESLSAVEGQIGTKNNRNTLATSTNQRAGKKIEKSVHNNDAEKTILMQKKSDTTIPAKKVQEEQGGKGIENLQYAILTDNQGQLPIIRHSMSIVDDIKLRQRIKQRKTVLEVR